MKTFKLIRNWEGKIVGAEVREEMTIEQAVEKYGGKVKDWFILSIWRKSG